MSKPDVTMVAAVLPADKPPARVDTPMGVPAALLGIHALCAWLERLAATPRRVRRAAAKLREAIAFEAMSKGQPS